MIMIVLKLKLAYELFGDISKMEILKSRCFR